MSDLDQMLDQLVFLEQWPAVNAAVQGRWIAGGKLEWRDDESGVLWRWHGGVTPAVEGLSGRWRLDVNDQATAGVLVGVLIAVTRTCEGFVAIMGPQGEPDAEPGDEPPGWVVEMSGASGLRFQCCGATLGEAAAHAVGRVLEIR